MARNAPTDDGMCDALCAATHEVEVGSPMALHDLRSLVFHWVGDPDAQVLIEFEGASYPIAEYMAWDIGEDRPTNLVLIAGDNNPPPVRKAPKFNGRRAAEQAVSRGGRSRANAQRGR